MKTIIRTLLLIIAGFIVFSFIGYNATPDILKKLGISPEEAKNGIWNSFSSGTLAMTINQTMRQITEKEKATIVIKIGQYVKEYTRTKEFKEKFLEYRNQSRPAPPEKPISKAEFQEKQRTEITNAIKNAEESKKLLQPEQQGEIDKLIAELNNNLKSIENSINPNLSYLDDSISNLMYRQSMEEYKIQISIWEKENPTSPDSLIKKRLQEFLLISENIDFNAKLVKGEYNKMLFENSEYQAKSGLWKMCFRAGKNTITTARSFAKQWLTELK